MTSSYGRYELLERLGRGGMAEVFLARMNGPLNVSRYVALKRILPDFSTIPELNEMFLDEIRLAVHLSHPSIAALYDFGMEDDCIFLTMELVEGQDLRSVLRRALQGHRMSLECALYIVAQVARALSYAHGASDAQERPLGIVHRDITPSNVLVSYRGDVKLVDFGIARAASHVRLNQTRSGEIKGTIRYMSPEQASGKVVDSRSDLFSLTTVLLETVIGRPAFKAESDVEALRLVQGGRAPERDQYPELIHDDVGAIIDRGMQADPAARYQSGEEMATALELALRNRAPAFGPSDLGRVMSELFASELVELKKRMRAHADGTAPAPASVAAAAREESFSVVMAVADTVPAMDTPPATGELQPREPAEPAASAPNVQAPGSVPSSWQRNVAILVGSAGVAVVAALLFAPRAPAPRTLPPQRPVSAAAARPTAPAPVPPPIVPAAAVPATAPAPAPTPHVTHTAYGTLNLQSAPWAAVEIDGKPAGQTPLVDFRISAGRHRVTLTNPGLPKKTVKIVVRANQPVNETVALTE